MAKRRASKRNARNKRSSKPKRLLHGLLKGLKEVTQPGRHVTGGKGVSGRSRPNPWPRCPSCFRRVPALCDEGCGMCKPCCPGHKEKDQETRDEQ